MADELSVLRHEMANVINGLAGMAELLRSSQLSPEQLHWLGAIEESAEQARFLLRCDAADAGPAVERCANLKPVSGVRLIEQIVMAHTPAMLKARRRLLLELDPGLPACWRVDTALLRQVLDNLVANAFKYARCGDILLSAQERQGAVVIRIDDEGPGVAGCQREKIFEPRQRGAIGPEIPGEGLGLSLSRELAGRMNGTLRCVDAPGGGARFELSLREAAIPERAPSPGLRALSLLDCRLGLEPMLERIVRKMLKRLNVRCTAGHAPPENGRVLPLTIVGADGGKLSGRPVLWLQPAAPFDDIDRVAVQPPLVESSLRRGLLRQVLVWRWALSQRGETPG